MAPIKLDAQRTRTATLDESIGEFVLSKPDLKISDQSKMYNFNKANTDMWDTPMRSTVERWHSWRV